MELDIKNKSRSESSRPLKDLCDSGSSGDTQW